MHSSLQPVELLSDRADEADIIPPGMEFPDTRPFLPQSLHIPGALHVVDNLQKDLGEKLHHYASHVRSLKLFQPLLGDRDYRERLQWTCLQGPYR